MSGLVVPIIVELTFEDGTTETQNSSTNIWRMNDKSKQNIYTDKAVHTKIVIDQS
jgi:hypothetical protein